MEMVLTFAKNGGSMNWNSPSNTYINAMVFSLAHPYGTPSILSSYSGFTNTDQGSPNNGTGSFISIDRPFAYELMMCYDRCRNMFCDRRNRRLALSTSANFGQRDGWIQKHSWKCAHDKLGVTTITTNSVRKRFCWVCGN